MKLSKGMKITLRRTSAAFLAKCERHGECWSSIVGKRVECLIRRLDTLMPRVDPQSILQAIHQ